MCVVRGYHLPCLPPLCPGLHAALQLYASCSCYHLVTLLGGERGTPWAWAHALLFHHMYRKYSVRNCSWWHGHTGMCRAEPLFENGGVRVQKAVAIVVAIAILSLPCKPRSIVYPNTMS